MATSQTDETHDGEAEKQQVAGSEWLLRAIPPSQYAATDAEGKPSSAPFKEDLFSVDIDTSYAVTPFGRTNVGFAR